MGLQQFLRQHTDIVYRIGTNPCTAVARSAKTCSKAEVILRRQN